MAPEEWERALSVFQANPSYESFLELTQTIPFSAMCQFALKDESANDVVATLLPVIEECVCIEEVARDFIIGPAVVRICELSDVPIENPTLTDGTDRFEAAENFVGIIRTWAFTERHPDRRLVLKKTVLLLIRVCGTFALSLTEHPEFAKGLQLFEELLCGLWLNMLDAENTRVATNMLDILKEINTPWNAHHERVIPKERHFAAAAVKVKHFDDNLQRWLRMDLTEDERSDLHTWAAGLIGPLKARVDGEATLLGDVDPSTCRIRAAIALIRLMDLSPQLQAAAAKENICANIVLNLYFTDDALLKLAAGEVIIEELLESPSCCRSLFEARLLSRVVDDLESNETDVLARRGGLRLLANVFERVPESRQEISKDTRFVTQVRRLLLDEDPDMRDVPLGISCVGALMSLMNPVGVLLVSQQLPEWRSVFEKALVVGDEHSATAAVMALTRMVAGPKTASGRPQEPTAQPGTKEDDELRELHDKLLRTIDSELTPILIKQTYPKPFLTVRVLIYQLFEALMTNWRCYGAADCYRSTPALAEQLFNFPSDKTHEVLLARHHYIKRLSTFYTCDDEEFNNATTFCANHGPYDKPPLFAEPEFEVAEEAA